MFVVVVVVVVVVERVYVVYLYQVLHMVTAAGYARAWPHVFSEGPGARVEPRPSSLLTQAMDVAR